jgi:predicted membrane channel-forming protein YqfA (hemolysin III family)
LFSVVLWPEVKQVAMVVLTPPLHCVIIYTQQTGDNTMLRLILFVVAIWAGIKVLEVIFNNMTALFWTAVFLGIMVYSLTV